MLLGTDGGAKLPTKTKFDGVLVDAPCSGIGTWSRNPDMRWRTAESVIAEKAAGQNSGGTVDLIWINGPNFLAMKEQGLLHGPFVAGLPNTMKAADTAAALA